MNRSPLIIAFAFAACVTACGPKKHPKPPPPEVEPTVEPDPPPPPPPKCEKLDEKCKAKGGKKAKIAQSLLMFEPVTGWVYAQGEKATISQASDEDACLAVAGYDVPDAKDAKKLEAARQSQLEALAGELKLNLGKSKVAWKKSQDDKDGKLPLVTWGLAAVERGAKKGELLIVSTAPDNGKAIFGVAFVPSDDANDSGTKLVGAFHSFAPGEDKQK